jgi:hypothetical protein
MGEIIDMAEKIVENESNKKKIAREYFIAYFALIGLTLHMGVGAEKSEETAKEITCSTAKQLQDEGFKVENESKLLATTLVCTLQFSIRSRTQNKEQTHKFVDEFFDNMIWDKCISIA